MNILSIDPGETTGVCMAKGTHSDFEVLFMLEIPWQERFATCRALIAGTYPMPNLIPLVPEVVVIENFRLRGDKARSQIGKVFPSSKIIGMVEYICWVHRISLVVQEPGQRSRVKVLEEHKKFITGAHMTDAYQHARYYWLIHVRGK